VKLTTKLLAATAMVSASAASAVELEVTHWWTSGGEAAAVSKFAEAWNATGNTWVDGAIAGSGGTARPIIISRILGGDPMAATQLNHGRQAEELIEAGLMLDLTDVAEAGGWTDIVNPSGLLESCTLDGKIYCVPVNIHSFQWLWLSHAAFEAAGVDVPTNWSEYVASADALEAAGKIPLAMGQQGWQQNGAFGVMAVALAGQDAWLAVNAEKDAAVAAGPEYAKVFEGAVAAREMAKNSNVQDWNQATNLVITGAAGGQIMGDWAQGEFSVAEAVAGDFNLAKGSLPVRGDIDLSAANDCMQKGLEILASGSVLPSGDQNLSADTTTQIEDLMAQFWTSEMSAAEAQGKYAEIIAKAD